MHRIQSSLSSPHREQIQCIAQLHALASVALLEVAHMQIHFHPSLLKCLLHKLSHVRLLLLRIILQACPLSLWNYNAATTHPTTPNSMDG